MKFKGLIIATSALWGLTSDALAQEMAAKRPKVTFGGATPLNAGDWFRYLDYPRSALRTGAKGTVGMSFTISAKGRVDSCHVFLSSQNAEMDKAACRVLTRRARFKPATDSQGMPISTSGNSYARFWTE